MLFSFKGPGSTLKTSVAEHRRKDDKKDSERLPFTIQITLHLQLEYIF